jgi:hypothetical protein
VGGTVKQCAGRTPRNRATWTAQNRATPENPLMLYSVFAGFTDPHPPPYGPRRYDTPD